MKTPSEDEIPRESREKKTQDIARLMGLGERSVQKSYYPQLQQKIGELEKSEHQYRLLAENISDVIWMLGDNMIVEYISPSIERMSGHKVSDLLGKPFTDLLVPEHAQKFTQEVAKATALPLSTEADPRKLKEMELCQINRDGSITWTEVRVSCLAAQAEGAPKLLGISRDINRRIQAQQEKAEMQQQLLQVQKMESVGTLAGGIAHDFNNLLTVINGYAGLLSIELESDHPMEEKVTAIIHAGKRAAELTRQLLAFSRKQIFTPRILDINGTINEMDKMLRRLIGEDIHVKTILERGISPISADQTQIEQIFTNLIINARDALKALPEAKTIRKQLTIETGQTYCNDDTAAKLGLENSGSYIFFSVSDNGIGMDTDTRKRIFEPFFTTKSKYEGTGLGLAMIYGIVKQNHGAILVYSEPGHGAMFKIYWPAAENAEESTDEPLDTSRNLSGSESVLLVEDDSDVLNFAANALMSLGYTTYKTRNGKEALEWVEHQMQSGSPLPEIVVTDMIMPEMSGTIFAAALEQLAPEIKLIYVSGHTDSHIAQNGMLDSGVNFIQKPYSQQDLAAKIRKVLDSK